MFLFLKNILRSNVAESPSQFMSILPSTKAGYTNLVKKTYAVLKLASSIMSEADDIEDLYNAKKLVDFAFIDWPLIYLFSDAEYVYLTRNRFYHFYHNYDFIKRSVLNKKRTAQLHSKLKDVIRKIENMDIEQLNYHVSFVESNEVDFINAARRTKIL